MSNAKNTAYNLAGALVPLLVTLIVVPVYLQAIGAERFGVLSLAWLLLGYFGLLDLGLSRATARFVAAAEKDKSEQDSVVQVALVSSLALGFFGMLLVWPTVNPTLINLLKADVSLKTELMQAYVWPLLSLPAVLLSSCLVGVLQGQRRFLALNAVQTTGVVLFQILPLLAAKYVSVNLTSLLFAAFFAKVITVILLAFVALRGMRRVPILQSFRRWAIKLFKFGGWVSVSSIVGPVMTMSDRFLIGHSVGVAAVAYYTVPFQLARRGTLLASSFAGAMFPRLVTLDRVDAQRVARDSTNFLICLSTPFFLVGLMLFDPFLDWWLGEEFLRETRGVGEVLLIAFWLNGVARIPFSLLQASNRPHVVAGTHLLELLPYLMALYVALVHFGVMGAAIVFGIRVAVDLLILSWLAGILSEVLPRLATFFVLLVCYAAKDEFSSFGHRFDWHLNIVCLLIALPLCWLLLPGPTKRLLLRRSLEF